MKYKFLSLALMVSSAYASVPTVGLYPSNGTPVETATHISRLQPVTDKDVAANVAKQAQLPGNVILWVNGKDAEAYKNFELYLREALKYPGKFTHVYIYDEVYWGPNGYEAGLHRKEIETAADMARRYGFQTIVTILPFVLSQPDFKLDLSKFDVVAVDVYPSIPLNVEWGSCYYSANYYQTTVHCSVQRLRELGFHGPVGYIYQAFGLTYESHETLVSHLEAQRVAVCSAKELGVAVTMAFGEYLGVGELQREPMLFPLWNTRYAHWVRPC